MSNIEKNVLDAIERGEVKMRPRWHFVLSAVLMALICIVLLLLLIYFASMVIFTLQENGAWFAYNFGFSGWYLLLRSLPLILMTLLLIFAVAIALLARRYAFVYHRPLLYLLLIIAGLTTVGSFLVVPTAFHRAVMQYAAANNIPLVDAFYEFEEAPPSSVHRGQVVMIASTSNTLVLEDIDGETTTVVFPATTSFGVGDVVVVFGDINASDTIHPFGAEKIAP